MNRYARLILLSLSLFLWPTFRQLTPAPAVKAAPAMAGFTVNMTDDTPDANLNDNTCADANGRCSLRAAISQANALGGSNTISFAINGTINLTGALPDITNSLTINGPGARALTVRRDTGGDYRIFNIPNAGLNIALSGLTISNANLSEFGGGINSKSHLTLTDCAITDNAAYFGAGGVFLVGASGVFTGCTFNGNTGGDQGGGIYFQGTGGYTLQMVNCTISGNTATGAGLGGGIVNFSASGNSTLELTNCTIADNTSQEPSYGGGGLTTISNSSGAVATTRLRNTLVAGNGRDFAILNVNSADPSVLTSLGHNLDGDGSSGFTNGVNGDLVGTNAAPLNVLLAPLGDNGGPTQTHALLPGSPALNKGDNCVLTANGCGDNNSPLTTDQRGSGFSRLKGSAVDIGAYETFCSDSFVVNTTADTQDTDTSDGLCKDANGQCSLRAAITQANATPPCNALTITLPAGIYTQTLVASTNEDANMGGDWDIKSNITISGAGSGATILQAATTPDTATERVLEVLSGTVVLRDLSVRYGKDSTGSGGGINNLGNLTMQRVIISQNIEAFDVGGGGGINSSGPLTLTDCSITENKAGFSGGGVNLAADGTFTGCSFSGNTVGAQGGGIFTYGNTLHLSNCTVSGNTAYGNGFGGGIGQGGFAGPSTLEAINCTITGNISARNNGSGIYVASTTRLRNTLFAGNAPSLSNNGGTVLSLGHNLASDGGGGLLNAPGDLINTNPLLAPLGDYGGPTPTHALLPGSPALDAGDNCVLTNSCADSNLGFNLTTDQRGFNRQIGSAVDIGAFESRGFTLALTGGNNQSTPVTQAFAQPLAVQVSSPFNEPIVGGRVLFSAPTSGPSANLSATAVPINAQGFASVNATANLFPGAYQVTASAPGLAPVAFNLSNTCPALALSPGSLPGSAVGANYAQTLSVSGAFAGSAAFSLSGGALPPGVTLAANGTLSGMPTTVGSFSFTVKATDTLGCFGTQSYMVSIVCAPLVLSPGTLASTSAGVAFSQALSATGSGARSFSLAVNPTPPAWLSLTPNGLLSGTPPAPGSFSFVVNVTDAQGCTGTQAYTLTVGCPNFTLTGLPNATAGSAYSAQLTASPAGGNYQFSSADKPAWLTLTNSGALSGTPPGVGTFSFNVTVTGFGTCTQTRAVTLLVTCPALSLNPVTLPSANLGAAYNQTVTASPAGTAYSYLVTTNTLPPGLTLHPASGVISGAPTAAGNYTFVITATGWVNGAASCSATRSYNLLVTATCPSLTLSPGSLAAAPVGTAYSQSFTASGGTAPYSFSVTAGTLPPGLSLSSVGSLSGTPTTAGTFNFTVTATGTGGCSGNQTYTLTLTCPTITLTPASLSSATAGVVYNQTMTASPAGAYSYSLVTGNLPPGLSLNAATGALTGTATATGSYAFSVKAERGVGCSAVKAYTIVVNCPTVAVNPASLPNGSVSTAYNQTLSATPSASYAFAVSGGTLPGGLTLSTAGSLSGTPTASGTFNFTVKATGFGSCFGTRSYTVTIAAACATVTLPSLPNGVINAAYYGDLSGTLPSGSYTFSLTDGALPAGLSLDNLFGALVGTPTASGTFAFTLKATHTNGCVGTRTYNLVVGGGAAARAELTDYDGDGQSDPVLWRAATGSWNLLTSAQSRQSAQTWGAAGDLPLLGDYDGDGKTDLAVFRPSNATWYVQRSSDGQAFVKAWGLGTDVPVPGDYDGDGKTDLAVWRGSNGTWYVQRSSDGQATSIVWGSAAAAYQDVPVTGDFDGDGKTDVAVFRRTTGTWLVKRSSDGQFVVKVWGLGTDTPVAADYDGDGRTDLAVWRGKTGEWFVLNSTDGGYQVRVWGAAGDLPVVGDYDGDGQADGAVWRAAAGQWYVRLSATDSTRTVAQGTRDEWPVSYRALER